MKKSSFTYKMLKWADARAYYDLDCYGTTTACNIVQGVIKALLQGLGFTVLFLFMIALLSFVVFAFGSILAYLFIPLLTLLDIEGIFSASYYTLGLTATIATIFMLIISAIGEVLTGNMKVAPNWLKNTTDVVADKSPHWFTLWWKGVKEKTCYIVKLEK